MRDINFEKTASPMQFLFYAAGLADDEFNELKEERTSGASDDYEEGPIRHRSLASRVQEVIRFLRDI